MSGTYLDVHGGGWERLRGFCWLLMGVGGGEEEYDRVKKCDYTVFVFCRRRIMNGTMCLCTWALVCVCVCVCVCV